MKSLDHISQKHEVIIIDDGSNDGSGQILKKYKNVLIVTNKKNYGKGYSIRKGVEYAKNSNIILMDGDLEVNANDIPFLINAYESIHGCSKKAVVGIRWEDLYKLKLDIMGIGNLIINVIFNLAYKSSHKDILCCYKVLSKENIKELQLNSKGFSLETELMAKMVNSNYKFMNY